MILSGGAGTRLWPLSSPRMPKQFSALVGPQSLFAMTMERLAGLDGLLPAIVVTGAAHVDLVRAEVAAGTIETSLILVEPAGRNTAPAVIAAALAADPTDVLLILPSDHLVADPAGFRSAVEVAAGLADRGDVVTFGIRPTRPETGYGYIEIGEPREEAFVVARFKEKPEEGEAAELIADERNLWNSGMFVVRADRVIAEASEHSPELLAAVTAAIPGQLDDVTRLAEDFARVEAISFDHAVMERTRRAVVVPLDVGWDDVGSYRSLLAASDLDEAGNSVVGDVVLSDVSGSFVRATSRKVVVAGLDDVVVVETPDAELVVPIDRAQEVRHLGARDS